MEVSALRYSSGGGLQGRSPLLKLQSDERLVALIRRGNVGAFEILVSRYQARLLSFCRHLLNSREDAEDVLQEVMAASYNAMIADERPINVRPWLYRIARNRCLNHLRKATAVGVDSMDVHFHDHGTSTADRVHEREEFRELVGDIHQLPETQRTALVLREMDALSYEQIAEAMDTTVSSVKSLLVRARVSLAEAAEARTLTCEDVREELGQVAEGLLARMTPPVRRHVKACTRCKDFQTQLKKNNKALAALFPVGLLAAVRQLVVAHVGHSSTGATAAGSAAGGGSVSAGTGAAAGGAVGSAAGGGGGFITAGAGALATKAAAGVAVATLVTAGTVAVTHSHHSPAPVAHTPHVVNVVSIGATQVASKAVASAAGAAKSGKLPKLASAPRHKQPAPKHAVAPATRKATTTTAATTTATVTATTPVTTTTTTVPSTTAAGTTTTPATGTTTTPTSPGTTTDKTTGGGINTNTQLPTSSLSGTPLQNPSNTGGTSLTAGASQYSHDGGASGSGS
jgi:RNA polymerase sigma factor (sigma-70 family)